MPKTKHDMLKRKLAQVYLGLDREMLGLVELHEIFEPDHPELATALLCSIESLDMVQVLLTRFWREAWGTADPRWETWV